ncbi:MAG: hypothetical protein IT445_08075 [Phycisphaeraceae bacterium]|nr:hypothetical protein [Phycisphaeraceae bacterium]
MNKVIEWIVALSDLVDAQATEMRRGTQQAFASLLMMIAIFVLALGGVVVAGIGAYLLLARTMSPGGAALFLGTVTLLIAAGMALWVRLREND